MKAIFILQEDNGLEILNTRNNIERLRRLRCLYKKWFNSEGGNRKTPPFSNRRTSMKNR